MKARKKSSDPRVAIAYLRVSTDDQALGPDAQLEIITQWATAKDICIVSVHRDIGVSGGAELAQRPALMEALRSLEEVGAGVLVVARRDRLARDVFVAAAIERLVEAKDGRIIAADGTGNADGPEGMLLRGLVDLFAQYERALIRSRTSAALAVKKSRGERVGALPIGYGVGEGGELVANEGEQAALARMRELRAAGFSTRAIADVLGEEGFRARGRRWHASTVARLVERVG